MHVLCSWGRKIFLKTIDLTRQLRMCMTKTALVATLNLRKQLEIGHCEISKM